MTVKEFNELLTKNTHYLLDVTVLNVTEKDFYIDNVFQDSVHGNIYHSFQYISLKKKLVYSVYNVFIKDEKAN